MQTNDGKSEYIFREAWHTIVVGVLEACMQTTHRSCNLHGFHAFHKILRRQLHV